jgi:hypothetical protein
VGGVFDVGGGVVVVEATEVVDCSSDVVGGRLVGGALVGGDVVGGASDEEVGKEEVGGRLEVV